ncbi:hypothetical protein [Myxococcus stipitatus]|nr:hypothetical protein [Myxococcus stipitatus]
MLAILACAGAGGCASSRDALKIRVVDDAKGPVRYEGPLAGPHDSMEALVEAACERMREPPASSRDGRSWGYCAVFFSAPDDEGREKWFVGHVAPLRAEGEVSERYCVLPIDLVAPSHTEMLALGGAYEPRLGRQDWHPTLFLNERTGKTWERDVLVFSLSSPDSCRVNSYIGFSRVVTALQKGKFVPVGTVYNGRGRVEQLAVAD